MSNPAAEKLLKRQLTDGSVKLVSQTSNEPAFQKQLSIIGQKGFDEAEREIDALEDESYINNDDPSDCELQFENKDAQDQYVDKIVNIISEEKKDDGIDWPSRSKGTGAGEVSTVQRSFTQV